MTASTAILTAATVTAFELEDSLQFRDTRLILILTTASGVFGRYLYRHLPAFKRAFAVWKPAHVIETIMFFGVALTHVATVDM